MRNKLFTYIIKIRFRDGRIEYRKETGMHSSEALGSIMDEYSIGTSTVKSMHVLSGFKAWYRGLFIK